MAKLTAKLEGRIALVTGASRGIGSGIAERFAAEGAWVFVNYAKSAAEAEAVVERIRAGGGRADALQADVGQRAACVRLVERVVAQAGELDIVVNNAGIAVDLPIASLDEAAWRRVLAVNLDGAFFCSQAAASHMRRPNAKIINVSAATALSGRKNGANYCAAKAGVMALTKCFALEYAPRIQVNCLVPGFTRTDDVVRRFGFDDPERLNAQLAKIPMGRLAELDDIAKGALFLASADSDFMTGQSLFVNGGSFM